MQVTPYLEGLIQDTASQCSETMELLLFTLAILENSPAGAGSVGSGRFDRDRSNDNQGFHIANLLLLPFVQDPNAHRFPFPESFIQGRSSI